MSFRTKDYFTGLLNGSLTSNLWNSIKNSLLGSELIAYAAEFLYQQELLADGVVSSVYPTNSSSLLSFLRCGNFNNVAFSYFQPASITVTLTDQTEEKFYEPFSLRLSKGNISYTNITWCSSNSPITLYQGNAKVISVSGESLSKGRFTHVTTEQSSSIYRTSSNSDYYSYFVLLEQLPLVDSVYVYSLKSVQNGGGWNTYQLYDPINAGAQALNFKLFWDNDLKLQLHFGNSLWGLPYQTDQKYFVYYLDATFTTIDTSGLVLEATNATGKLDYGIVSYQDYSLATDVVNRNLQNALSNNSVIATKSQVKSKALSHPLVSDCAVSVSTGNNVVIYVKPTSTDITDLTYYTDLVEFLQTYGELVVKYSVAFATPIYLVLKVTVLDEIDASVKQSVASEIQDYLVSAFTASTIGGSVDFSNLATEIYQTTGHKNIVHYFISSEQVQKSQLNFLPVVSSLVSQSDDYNIINGIVYSSSSFPQNVLEQFVVLGDFLVWFVDKTANVFSGSICYPVSFTFSAADSGFPVCMSTESFSSFIAFYGGVANNNAIYFVGSESQNYGYFDKDSDLNIISGVPSFPVTYAGGTVSSYKVASAFTTYGSPKFFKYNGKFYGLQLELNGSLLAIYFYNGNMDTRIKLSAFMENLEAFRGFQIIGDDLFIIINAFSGIIRIADFQNATDDSVSFCSLDGIDLSSTVTGLFKSYSFGLDTCMYLSSANTPQSDGRFATNLIDRNRDYSLWGTDISSTRSQFTVSYSATAKSATFIVPAVAGDGTSTTHTFEIVKADGSTYCQLLTHDCLSVVTCQFETSEQYYMKVHIVSDNSDHYANIVLVDADCTLKLNFSDLPVYSDGVAVSDPVTFTLPSNVLCEADSIQYSVSQADYTFVSHIDDMYFFIISLPIRNYYNHTTMPNAFKALNFYCMCRMNGTVQQFYSYPQKLPNFTDVLPLSVMSRVGAFNKSGKLTGFNGDITDLTVSYEAQNSYFDVDNTQYAVLSSSSVDFSK